MLPHNTATHAAAAATTTAAGHADKQRGEKRRRDLLKGVLARLGVGPEHPRCPLQLLGSSHSHEAVSTERDGFRDVEQVVDGEVEERYK